ncbi:hypothetical protein H477_2521 [[Clostridium] sordellii ATCC 9714]|nr:hypothetical protein H477_2521 [[Clostridium] sordellii ATCC 9714] [Paeniclostridium sordellii ATCC 9714]
MLDEAGWKLEEGKEYRSKDGKELELGFIMMEIMSYTNL